jgi:hypothetical protein
MALALIRKYAEQIFDMFVRLHGNSKYEGTGIGLALCKKIVEKHEGFISALSSENYGSTFISLYLLKLTKINRDKDMAKLTERNIFLADAYPSANAVILNDNGVFILVGCQIITALKRCSRGK